jgi:hypothetical protein
VLQNAYFVSARDRVAQYFGAGEMERLVESACAAAEQSQHWRPGDEFIFELVEPAYVIEGVERSAFIVHHHGKSYEVRYYDGMLAETISDHPSWESAGQSPPAGEE